VLERLPRNTHAQVVRLPEKMPMALSLRSKTVTVRIGFIINVSSHLENATISLIRIKKSPFSQLRKSKQD
jgi:hypothetical protein